MRKIYSFLLLGLLLSIGNVWATEQYYELTFNTTGTSSDGSNSWTTNSSVSNVLTAGSAYVSSISAVANVYPGRDGRGAKFGTSSKAGSITFALSDAGQVKATKVVITGGAYISSNAAEPASVKVNDGTAVAFDQTVITFTEEEITYNFPTPTDITTLKLSQVVANKGRLYIISVKVYYDDEGGIPDPSISAENVELEHDATNGNIDVVVNNPVTGGVLTAESSEDWLTIGSITSITSVPLTFAANSQATARTSVVTLTYTYNTNETVTKNVTVTQSANPNAVIDINAIDAGSITCNVKGTIVAMCARGLVVGDGTGYVYYYGGSSFSTTKTINDVVKISGTTSTYGNVIQFPGTATIEDADNSSYDNTPAVQALDAAGIGAYGSGLHLSDYVQLEGTLVKSNNYYNLQVENLATDASIAYPTTAQASEMDGFLNTYVIVKGYFAGNSSGHFNIVLESIEEAVAPVIPSINVDANSIEAPAAGDDGEVGISYENLTIASAADFDVQYYDGEDNEIDAPSWLLCVVEGTGTYQLSYTISANTGAARTAYLKVYALDNETNEVYSELITISQEAYVAPFVITDGVFDFTQDEDYGSGVKKSGVKEQTSTWIAVNVTMYMAGRNCWYNSGDGEIRLYKASGGAAAGNITLSAPEGNIITNIAFTGATLNKMGAEEGTYVVSNENHNASWHGFANSVLFTATDRTDIYTIEVTYAATASLTLGANGYSTFAAPFKYTVSGATAYKAKYQNGAIVLTQVNVIEAGEGIVLKGANAGDVVTITPSNDATDIFTDNELVGVLTPTLAQANWYVLATIDNDGITKFHPCEGVTIPANKAFIEIVENPSNAPIRIIEAGNEATNIQNVEGAEKAVKFMENGKLYIQKNGVVYDAMGKTVR